MIQLDTSWLQHVQKPELSENINPNKVFIVNRSELEGRIDSTFYVNRPDFHNTIRLSKIAKIKGGKRIPKDADYSDIDTPNLYLRVTDNRKIGRASCRERV